MLDQLFKILEWAALVVGPCLLVFSVVAAVRTRSFLRSCIEVAGEVIRLERSVDRGSTTYVSYAPVFSFTAADGKIHTVTSDISSSPADFAVGESVRVRYDPANPQDARIHSFFQTWGQAVITGAVALGFIGISCKLLGFL